MNSAELMMPLFISALQHYAYCPRQFALIHVEQVWADNYFTAEGNALHERVDAGKTEQRGTLRYERAVSVQSEQFGLQGKLDLLEIEKPIDKSLPLKYFPVEYKRGKPKVEDWDKIQLCAQALCLEEMRNINVAEGALWYWQVRRRESVFIDAHLRQTTINTIEAARKCLTDGHTPKPTDNKKRCKACSLLNICSPDVYRQDRSRHYVQGIFAIESVNQHSTHHEKTA